MPNNLITTHELTGKTYQPDPETTVHVFDGFAFRARPVGDDPDNMFYDAIPPSRVQDIVGEHEGEPVTETVYEGTSTVYIHRRGSPNIYGVTEYLIDDIPYRYEGMVMVQSSVDSEDDTEHVQLVNGWSDIDDIVIPLEELHTRIESGEIKQMWPVWEQPTRG